MSLNNLDKLVVATMKARPGGYQVPSVFNGVRHDTRGKVVAGGMPAIVKSLERLIKAGLVSKQILCGSARFHLTAKGKEHDFV